jgi:ABC-2 type transport system permease protein
LGIAALTVITILFYPTISDMPELSEVFEEAEVLASLFGGGFTDITSPEGYLNSQVYALMVPILFLIFSIAMGSGAIAGEEERGTLDLLLSNPTTRFQVLTQKFAAMIAAILVLGLVLWVSVVVTAPFFDLDISVARTAQISLSAMLLGAVFGTLALALGGATGKRGLTIGIAGAVAVLSYFVYTLALIADEIEPSRYASPFYYYIGADPLANGISLAHASVLVGLTAVLLAAAIVTFERRDLAV